jgi:hypothetical protein
VLIEPVVYRQARNYDIHVNWKGYGNCGMDARRAARPTLTVGPHWA